MIARSAGTPVTSDLEHVSDRVEQLIALVTFPIFEQNLPARITGERDPERALRKLRPLNEGLLVMTRGDQGAVALGGDTFHVAPAFEVEAVDVTGAGDVFRVAVVGGRVQYSRNGLLLRESANVPRYPLLLDTSLGSTSATVRDAVLGVSPPPPPGGGFIETAGSPALRPRLTDAT